MKKKNTIKLKTQNNQFSPLLFNLIRGSAFSISILCFFSLSSIPINAEEDSHTKKQLEIVADAILKNATFRFIDKKSKKQFATPEETSPDIQLIPESPYTDWRYWNGVLNMAMIRLGEILNKPAYVKFSQKNVAFGFDHFQHFKERHQGENKWGYPFGQLFILEELDDGGAMGASVIEVYHHDPQKRYRQYIEQVAEHMLFRQDRLKDGTFVRSFPHKWTLWADDLYMGISFLARMGELSNENRYFDDGALQVINFHKYLYNKDKGLMHHCWYSDLKRTGVAFWGRANGWAMVAQVDLLDRLPKNHPKRDTLLVLLQNHILGIARYQNKEGLWHQLLDKEDSYLETSCSAMFIYTIARAVNKGYIEPRYGSIAQRGWEGIMSRIRPDGQVEGVCTGTIVSNDLVYYYRRPAPLNDVHGIGTVLLAGSEFLKMLK